MTLAVTINDFSRKYKQIQRWFTIDKKTLRNGEHKIPKNEAALLFIKSILEPD